MKDYVNAREIYISILFKNFIFWPQGIGACAPSLPGYATKASSFSVISYNDTEFKCARFGQQRFHIICTPSGVAYYSVYLTQRKCTHIIGFDKEWTRTNGIITFSGRHFIIRLYDKMYCFTPLLFSLDLAHTKNPLPANPNDCRGIRCKLMFRRTYWRN